MRPPLYQPALTPRYGLVGEGSSAARGDDGAGTAEEAAAAGRDLQRRAARWLPALAGMAMARTTLAARVVPRDGLPALGWGCGEAAGTYVCAAHSGVTLAPVLGDFETVTLSDREAARRAKTQRDPRKVRRQRVQDRLDHLRFDPQKDDVALRRHLSRTPMQRVAIHVCEPLFSQRLLPLR